MNRARTETAGIVGFNLVMFGVLAWLAVRRLLWPVFDDPLLVVDVVGAAVLIAVVRSWITFWQITQGREPGWRITKTNALAQKLPLLGLIGTTVSLIAAFMVAGDHSGTLLADIGWCLRNTAVGLVGLLWVEHNVDLAETAAAKVAGAT